MKKQIIKKEFSVFDSNVTKKQIVKKEFVLFDSNEMPTYEEYVEFCTDNGIEYGDENSNDFYKWVGDTQRDWCDCFVSNMGCSKIDYPLMITGHLGLWNGTPEIYPVYIESSDYGRKFSNGTTGWFNPSIKKAVEKCMFGNSIIDADVHFDNGVIVINAHHHDGCNTFYVRKLSKKGIAAVQAASNRGEDIYFPKDYWFAKIKSDEIDF